MFKTTTPFKIVHQMTTKKCCQTKGKYLIFPFRRYLLAEMKTMQNFFVDAIVADLECECASPKSASLAIYLESENATSIWGSNFRFLFNILWAGVPLHSAWWHPQNLVEWFFNQPGITYIGVIAGLLLQLGDKGFASWLAKKFQIKPNKFGKVSTDNATTLTKCSFSSPQQLVLLAAAKATRKPKEEKM
jgi:hypothetical protein